MKNVFDCFRKILNNPNFVYFNGAETPHEAPEAKTCSEGMCHMRIEKASIDIGKAFEDFAKPVGLEVQEPETMEGISFYKFNNKEGETVMHVAYNSINNKYYLIDRSPFGERPLGEADNMDDLLSLSLPDALETNSSRTAERLKTLFKDLDCEVIVDPKTPTRDFVYRNKEGEVVFHIHQDYGEGIQPVYYYVAHEKGGEQMKLRSKDVNEIAYAVESDQRPLIAAEEPEEAE